MIGEHAERRRIHGVGDDVRTAGASGDLHARAMLVALASPVREADRVFHGADERREQIGVEIVRHALLHRRDALEPRPVSTEGFGSGLSEPSA
jgi:hypothetical protein